MTEVKVVGGEKFDPLSIFRKNIQDRIAADFSTLIPEEVMEKLIADSVNAMLYEDIIPAQQRSSYHHIPKPFIKDAVQKQSSEIIRAAIEKAMGEKKVEIHEMVAAYITENIGSIVAEVLLGFVSANTINMMNAINMKTQRF
jgi:hypothetical protein